MVYELTDFVKSKTTKFGFNQMHTFVMYEWVHVKSLKILFLNLLSFKHIYFERLLYLLPHPHNWYG